MILSQYLSIPIIISICGLIAALYKIFDEQKKYNKLRYTQEKRLEYKLRIYEILLAEILPIDEIATKFQNHSPFSIIDIVEIRKCIYEMLIEKTLVSFDDGSYTVDTMQALDENETDELL